MGRTFRIGLAVGILLVFSFGFCETHADEPNTAVIGKTSQAKVEANQNNGGENRNSEINAAKNELKAEFYKESLRSLWTALGIIVVLTLALMTYLTFKNTKEYTQALADVKDALKETKEASKEAREARDKAREWEEKAQERLASIDKEVADKLKQIEDKGKETIAIMLQEGEKQRKISELWSKGLEAVQRKDYETAADCFGQITQKAENSAAYYNWGNALSDMAERKEGDERDKLFAESFDKYKKATDIKPDDYEAYSNWGLALSEMAERKEGNERDKLFAEAINKCKKATDIKHDYHVAYNNWGYALSGMAKCKEGDERDELLKTAKEKCLKAESIKPGEGAYNLACISCVQGDEAECKKWLKVGEQAKSLMKREDAMKDDDLKSVWDKRWFKEICWKGE